MNKKLSVAAELVESIAGVASITIKKMFDNFDENGRAIGTDGHTTIAASVNQDVEMFPDFISQRYARIKAELDGDIFSPKDKLEKELGDALKDFDGVPTLTIIQSGMYGGLHYVAWTDSLGKVVEPTTDMEEA